MERIVEGSAYAFGERASGLHRVFRSMAEGAEKEKKKAEEIAARKVYCYKCKETLPPMEPSEKPEEEEVEEGLSIPSLLETLLRYLENYADLVPPFIVHGTAIFMHDFVESITKAIHLKLHCEEIHAQLTEILCELKRPSTVQQLTAIFRCIFGILRNNLQLKMYIHGFRLPNLADSITSPTSKELNDSAHKIISSLEETLPIENLTVVDKKELLNQEMDRFIQNTTHFLTIKIFHETIGQTSLKNTDYINLARETRGPNPAHLQTIINRSLREKHVNALRRGAAYLAYFFLFPLLQYFIRRLITVCYEELANKTQSPDEIARFKTSILTRLTDFLMIDQGAHRYIEITTFLTGSIDKMRTDYHDLSTSNGGYTSRELYAAYAESLIQKCTDNFLLSWLFKKIIGNKDTFVEALLHEGVKSLVDAQGYPHALNTLLVRQLEEALVKLRQSPMESSQEVSFSEKQQEEFRAFVDNLFVALKLYENTIPKIKTALNPSALTALIDSLIIEEVIASITHNLASIVNSMITEEKLLDYTLQFTRTINKIYDEPGKRPTEKETKGTEARFALLMEQLADEALKKALREKMELGPIKEQQETNRRIQLLREEVHHFATTAFQSLKDTKIHALPFTEAQTPLLQVLIDEIKYHVTRLQQQIQLLSPPSLTHFNNRYYQVLLQLSPYAETLKHLKRYHSDALQLQSLKNLLEEFWENHTQLLTFAEKNEVADYKCRHLLCQASLPKLRKALDLTEPLLDPEYKAAIDALINTHFLSINAMKNALNQLRFAESQEQENALIHSIYQRKKTALEQEAQTQSASEMIGAFFFQHNPIQMQVFAQDIQRLRNQNTRYEAESLNKALNALVVVSASSEDADANFKAYQTALQRYKEERNNTLDREREEICQQHQKVLTEVTQRLASLEVQLAKTYQEAQRTFEEAQTCVKEIADNSKATDLSLDETKAAAEAFSYVLFRPESYANIKLFDLRSLQDLTAFFTMLCLKDTFNKLKAYVKNTTTHKYALQHLFLAP